MGLRPLLTLGTAALALTSGGCGTVHNLGTEPFGACHQTPGVVYGGVRSDIVTFANYPIGGPLLWGPNLVADAIGDTVTLPIILARQGLEHLKTRSSGSSATVPAHGTTP